MVVTSTMLPPALPWTTTSPPTVSTLPVRLDQLVCRLIWLLRIWLPTPPDCCCDGSLQVPTPWAKAALVESARTEAARRILKDVMVGLLLFPKWGFEGSETAAQAQQAGPAAFITGIGTGAAGVAEGSGGLKARGRGVGHRRIRPRNIGRRIGRRLAERFAAFAQRIVRGT